MFALLYLTNIEDAVNFRSVEGHMLQLSSVTIRHELEIGHGRLLTYQVKTHALRAYRSVAAFHFLRQR